SRNRSGSRDSAKTPASMAGSAAAPAVGQHREVVAGELMAADAVRLRAVHIGCGRAPLCHSATRKIRLVADATPAPRNPVQRALSRIFVAVWAVRPHLPPSRHPKQVRVDVPCWYARLLHEHLVVLERSDQLPVEVPTELLSQAINGD